MLKILSQSFFCFCFVCSQCFFFIISVFCVFCIEKKSSFLSFLIVKYVVFKFSLNLLRSGLKQRVNNNNNDFFFKIIETKKVETRTKIYVGGEILQLKKAGTLRKSREESPVSCLVNFPAFSGVKKKKILKKVENCQKFFSFS